MLLSTLGAGLQSLAGAPRLLAAIGRDRLIPQLAPLAQTGKEPRLALMLGATGSCGCVMIGKLNGVAPFITMWFLTCYGIINGACAFLAYEKSPTFRPRWKWYDWRLSLLGASQCIFMMFLINQWIALAALAVAYCVYKYIQHMVHVNAQHSEGTDENQVKVDYRAGLRFQKARSSLLALRDGDLDFKYWRPFILFLCKTSVESGEYIPQRGMINLISQLMKRGKGLTVVSGVVEGEFTEENHQKTLVGRMQISKKLKEKDIEGFSDMVIAKTMLEGHRFLLHAKGLGSLRPNTVMIGW